VRLVDLDPRWFGAGGAGIYNSAPDGTLVPAPARHGVGVSFLCPCPNCTAKRTGERDKDFHLRHFISFTNPIDGGPSFSSLAAGDTRDDPHWTRIGDTFDTLQLSPSILSDPAKGGCGWHGYIGQTVPGEVTTC
jgi:hypothetical protein